MSQKVHAIGVQGHSSEVGRPADFVGAWQVLCEHPSLTWIPPMYRGPREDDAALSVAKGHALRAVESTMRVDVVSGDDGVRVLVSLAQLSDLSGEHGVDPYIPAVVSDDALHATASSFEEAVVALAQQVCDRLGPASGVCE